MADDVKLTLSRAEALHVLEILKSDIRVSNFRRDLAQGNPQLTATIAERLLRLVRTKQIQIRVLSCRPLEPGEYK